MAKLERTDKIKQSYAYLKELGGTFFEEGR